MDAIENAFIPLAIRNNATSGHDRIILKRFNEPAWNFQVMRFIDSEGSDIIPRKDRVWTPIETTQRMIQALEAVGRPVPAYLSSIVLSQEQSKLKTAAFSMYCFWDGEAKLGRIDGVIETEAGWLDGHEVVRLKYDPHQVEWATLVQKAQALGCAREVYAPDSQTNKALPKKIRAELYDKDQFRRAKASDQKRHLQFSKYGQLRLNPVQRTKINAAISARDSKSIQNWLSPMQLSQL